MTPRSRAWLRPLATAVILMGVWLVLTLPDSAGQGLAVWEILTIAIVLAAVITWRGTSWTNRLAAGASRWRIAVRAVIEGAVTGALIGLLTFGIAQNRLESDTPNLLGPLVIIPWLIIGAVIFALISLIVSFGRGAAIGHEQGFTSELP